MNMFIQPQSMVVASLPQATLRSGFCHLAGWAAGLRFPGHPDQSPGAIALISCAVFQTIIIIPGPWPSGPLTQSGRPGSAFVGAWARR